MDTFQYYLDNWEEKGETIEDNNFFYFEKPISGILTLPVEFETCTQYVAISNDIRTAFKKLTKTEPAPGGIEALTKATVQINEWNDSSIEEIRSQVHHMLKYCVKTKLYTVWVNTVLETVATNPKQ